MQDAQAVEPDAQESGFEFIAANDLPSINQLTTREEAFIFQLLSMPEVCALLADVETKTVAASIQEKTRDAAMRLQAHQAQVGGR